jgi:putative membrane protein
MRFAAATVAACLLSGIAAAQTTNPPANSPNAPLAPPKSTSSESHNPAVATTSDANDTVAPAKGSNSFTEGQAKDRIAQRGYSNVGGLKKDDDGVWRGTAQHSGRQVPVWLDYKGNVRETH